MKKKKISLNQLIADRGLRKDAIAEDMGITPASLSNKLSGRRGIKPVEEVQLAEILEVHPRIIRHSLPKTLKNRR